RTLQACGDIEGAISCFEHSFRTRRTAFRRTHAVTLGYLGAAHTAAGDLDEACATWARALGVIEDGTICSGRVRKTVAEMRCLVAPFRNHKIPAMAEIDERAARYLAGTG